jgi:hypothetical protein
MSKKELIQREEIEQSVLRIRGQNVMLDTDLAALYQVATKELVRAVKRNRERFPEDFMFQLSTREFHNLRCQFGTSRSWGGRRYPPYAFTEQGVAMLSSVLRSRRAAAANVEITRAFIRLRRALESHRELASKLDALEEKYDAQFAEVFEAIRELIAPSTSVRKRIGFDIYDQKL